MRLWTWLTLVVLLGPGCLVVEKRHPAPPHPNRHRWFRHHGEAPGVQDEISR
jgi:hypothetical protein